MRRLPLDARSVRLGCVGEPQVERLIVSGRLLDEAGRPVSLSLVEEWLCIAAGR